MTEGAVMVLADNPAYATLHNVLRRLLTMGTELAHDGALKTSLFWRPENILFINAQAFYKILIIKL